MGLNAKRPCITTDARALCPELPGPDRSLIPTVNVAEARGWPGDATPRAAEGLRVTAFARDLRHPRWLHVLPNGDVLVAETNGPERPDDTPGIKGWIFDRYQIHRCRRAAAVLCGRHP